MTARATPPVPDWVVLERIRDRIRAGDHVPAEVYEPDALADYVPALLACGHTISEIYRRTVPRRTA